MLTVGLPDVNKDIAKIKAPFSALRTALYAYQEQKQGGEQGVNGSAEDLCASRKAFEEWWLSSSGWAQADLESVRSGIGYLPQTMDLAWKGWQASAAHKEVTRLDKRWWRIETVPRGVKVLILRRGRGGQPKIDIAAYGHYGDVKGMHRGSGVFYANVTHWMPLPEIEEPKDFSGYSPL